jgi:hypothetical protein
VDFSIIVVFSQSKFTSGSVSCRFSATNLPEPSKFTIPIKTIMKTADLENYLRDLILELPRRVRVGPVEGLSSEL